MTIGVNSEKEVLIIQPLLWLGHFPSDTCEMEVQQNTMSSLEALIQAAQYLEDSESKHIILTVYIYTL